MIQEVGLVQETALLLGECPSMEALGAWIFQQDWLNFEYNEQLPDFKSGEAYSRNTLLLDPIEITLLRWKPSAESAVHHHKGFWGYVVCLSGQLEHHGFEQHDARLEWVERICASRGGILPEVDGTIHRLINGSDKEELVTLHVYAPPLKSLNGLMLYDLPQGDIYTCAESAPAALLDLPLMHYSQIARSVFSYRAPAERGSHIISHQVPKPNARTIDRLLHRYYQAQANDYDQLDEVNDRRRLYTAGVNESIADRLIKIASFGRLDTVLHLGCGTGRRALEIKERTSLNYQLLGFDVNPHMAQIAASRGIKMIDGYWKSAYRELEVDVLCFLYAFSHLANRAARENALNLMFQSIRPGGLLCVDVFNREDPYEWGPRVAKDFEQWKLAQQGYELGDVFYSRVGSKELAFLHYTTEKQMRALLIDAGFTDVHCTRIGYGNRPGNEVEEGGSLMFYAIKPMP